MPARPPAARGTGTPAPDPRRTRQGTVPAPRRGAVHAPCHGTATEPPRPPTVDCHTRVRVRRGVWLPTVRTHHAPIPSVDGRGKEALHEQTPRNRIPAWRTGRGSRTGRGRRPGRR